MGYTIYHNGELFYDSSLTIAEYALQSAQLDAVSVSQGTLVLTVPNSNVAYGKFEKFTSYIDVYEDGDLIFMCRVSKPARNFDNFEVVTCEGLMAILADSVQNPIGTPGLVTFDVIIGRIIEEHNYALGNNSTDRFVYVGTIAYSSWSQYDVEFEEFETTISRLQRFAEDMGMSDYMRLRRGSDNKLYFDWLEDFTTTCSQKIKLGENIIDITQEEETEQFCTSICPLGGYDKDTDERITVASVNNDSYFIDASDPRIGHPELMTKYGRIIQTVEFPDVESPALLLANGILELQSRIQTKLNVTVTAFDLKKAGIDTDAFRTWQKCVVEAPQLGDSAVTMNVVSISVDLTMPESFSMILGEQKQGYVTSSRSSSQIAAKKAKAEYSTKGYLSDAIQRATALFAGSMGGYRMELDTDNDGYIDEVVFADTNDLSTAQSVWRINSSGWGHSSTGYNGPYTMAATMDGLVATAITTGILKADLIKAGVLSDGNGNFTLNLATGACVAKNLSITGGSINITAASSATNVIQFKYGNLSVKMTPAAVTLTNTYNKQSVIINGTDGIIALADDDGTNRVVLNGGGHTGIGSVVADVFTGNANTATTASKLGTATVGGVSNPIYLNAGVPTACERSFAPVSILSSAIAYSTSWKRIATDVYTKYQYYILFFKVNNYTIKYPIFVPYQFLANYNANPDHSVSNSYRLQVSDEAGNYATFKLCYNAESNNSIYIQFVSGGADTSYISLEEVYGMR